jgi:hypothetical protein
MIIRIETQYETFTTEFKNVDANMEQITLALTGMLLGCGWNIETISKYIKTENDEV